MMSEEVTISVKESWYKATLYTLKELSEDLECELNETYKFRKDYPSIMRKYDRDMAIVKVAKKLLEEQTK